MSWGWVEPSSTCCHLGGNCCTKNNGPDKSSPQPGTSPMITSMKSTNESVPFKHSVDVIHYAKYSIGGVNMGE